MYKNTNYIKQQIAKNEIIYIDTCSLMNPNRLSGFLEIARPLLLNEKRKITIHNCVMEELFKLKISSNLSKRSQANEALNIIYKNPEIFEIIPTNYDDDSEFFADKELLKEIFVKRRKHTILLISNDHFLTSDAYNFNKVESVNGNKIHVCYLNYCGDLNICDCARTKNIHSKIESISPEKEVEQNPTIIIQKEYIEKKRNPLETIGITLATVAIGTISGFMSSKLLTKQF